MAIDTDSPSEADCVPSPPTPSNPPASSSKSHPSPTKPHYTFTQIIDADHLTIQQLAKRIRRLLSTLDSSTTPSQTPAELATVITTLKPLLQNTTWRLLRHDLSEELVMRPTFLSVLGADGQHMADHDRADHTAGREALLTILTDLSALESLLADASVSTSTAMPNDIYQAFQHLSANITDTFNTLQAHMTLESGEFLPRFESSIDEETSRRLAREYACTLVLSPDVIVAARNETERKPLFPGGVTEYINSDLERLKACYEAVLRDGKGDGGIYIEEMVLREIERLRVGKWVALDEWKALKEGGGGGGVDDRKGKL